MGGIFISYRRKDTPLFVGRLRDTLSRHFGAEQVFRDINTIKPGERFPDIVERAIQTCNAVLVVIGPTWLTVTESSGRRRLDNPSDLVRQEVATALARSGLLVIPILVEATPMPTADELPEPLASLAYCNAIAIADDVWDYKIAELTRELETVQRPAGPLALQDSAPQALASRALVSSLRAPGTGMATQQRELAVAKLVESVHLQWEEEAKIRGLFDPDPMPVQWTLTEHDVSDHSRLISADPLTISGSSDRIAELTVGFLALSRRRLVILGGPGSGKTTVAMQLLLRLLEVRESTDPVPVLLTANGWGINAHPRLQDWLAFRLSKDYPALRAIDEAMPRELVDNGMVLPVIDGLDEIDPDYRPTLLATLNASLGGNDPLILTCRTDEYVDTIDHADVLTAAAVIEGRPLTAAAAADYLDGCLAPRQRRGWDPIFDTLRRDGDAPVADVCSTPLGLWLLRTVYIENKGDPTPLIDPAHYPDADAIKAHLFDELIPALITKRRPVSDGSDPLRPRRGWEPDPARRWLAYLAGQLRGERDLRWWQLSTTVPPRVITTLMVLMGVLVSGLIAGLLNGVGLIMAGDRGPADIASELMVGLVSGLMLQLVFGTVFGLLVGPKVRRTPEPGYANLRRRDRGRTRAGGLVGGLMLGLVVGLSAGLVSALVFMLTSGGGVHVTFNLEGWQDWPRLLAWIFGLIGALVFLLAGWVRSPGSNHRSRTQTSTYRGSRKLITLGVLVVGAIGVLRGKRGGNLAEVLEFPAGGLVMGMLYGLAGGLALGLARWVRSPGRNDRSRTPTSTYTGSRNLMILKVLVLWTMGTLMWGLVFGLLGDVVDTVVSGSLFALMFGLVVAPMQEPAWIGFVVTSRWLACRGTLPWRTMRFLDDAHRLGLLRTAGAVYQFRHAELQDHLAKSPGDRSTSPTEITDDAEGSKLSS